MIIRLRAPALARLAASFAVAAACALATATGASAQGELLIQHAGQKPDTYERVYIQLLHNTLNVTSEDGKGTLIITRAACSYEGAIFVCLPTGVTLIQGGDVHALDLLKGTVYANMTDATQHLPLSSTQVPPRGIQMTLLTEKGTYINLVGKIDRVTK